MSTAELAHLIDRLSVANKSLRMGEVVDVPLSKNDIYAMLSALDLYGAVKRVAKD